MNSKLAIITVNYNAYRITSEFLACFKETAKNHKIFISDLSDKRETILKREDCEVILTENKGYAHGVNVGLQKALEQGFEYFAIINNDTRIENNFAKTVIESIQKHPNSLIGAKIYYEKNFEYHKDRYEKNELGKVLWYAGGNTDWAHAYSTHRGVDEVDKGQYDREEKTDFITGCFVAHDRKTLETVGYWDESYFLYYEDADYSERAKRAGISLIYDPTITIWHKNAQSTGGSGSKLHEKYQRKNRLKFGLKYAPLRTKLHLIKNYLSGK